MTTEDGVRRSRPFRRFLFTLAVLFLAGVGAAAFFMSRHEPEPQFEGRTLSQWLPEIQSQDTETHRKAVEAFRKMGPKAVPFLIADLKRTDSFLKAKMLALVRQQVPSRHALLMSQSERHQRSINVLRQMQPHSKEVIAALSAHLNNTNTGIWALNALVPVGDEGPLRAETAEPLTVALRSADVGVRRTAASVMHRLPSDNPRAIAALQRSLGDPDKSVRLLAAMALTRASTNASVIIPAYVHLLEQHPGFEKHALRGIVRFESQAVEAVPVLIRLAKGENNELRQQAVYTLGRIHCDGERVLPFLVSLLEDKDSVVARNAAFAIGAFGNEASNAIPFLIKAKESRDEQVRDAAIYTLKMMPKTDAD